MTEAWATEWAVWVWTACESPTSILGIPWAFWACRVRCGMTPAARNKDTCPRWERKTTTLTSCEQSNHAFSIDANKSLQHTPEKNRKNKCKREKKNLLIKETFTNSVLTKFFARLVVFYETLDWVVKRFRSCCFLLWGGLCKNCDTFFYYLAKMLYRHLLHTKSWLGPTCFFFCPTWFHVHLSQKIRRWYFVLYGAKFLHHSLCSFSWKGRRAKMSNAASRH